MTDERYKKIMADLGMPNSQSLLVALKQVANEAGQECVEEEREACARLCESLYGPRYYWGDGTAFAKAIRERSNIQ